MNRHRVGLALVALAGLALTSCGTSGSPAATSKSTRAGRPTTTSTSAVVQRETKNALPLPSGQSGAVSAIPWSSVGPGWLLATWSSTAPSSQIPPPTTAPSSIESLFLVDPEGGRYLVTTFPQASNEALTAWSGDGRRALLSSAVGNGQSAKTLLTVIDLSTGRNTDSFSIPQTPPNSITFSRPDGLAVLASLPDATSLVRYGLDGSTQLTYPGTFSQLGSYLGGYLSSPDGTQILMGTDGGVAVVANDGTVTSQLAVPGGTATAMCRPVRWWSSGVALAACGTHLWEVPLSGATPTALTATPVPPDSGDLNAWDTPNGVYLQDAGGCGYQYLAKLQPNATTSPVTVPDVDSGDSQFVLGTYGDEIGLWATVSCGAGVSALWFNPVTNTSTVVLGPPLNGGSVTAVLAYPDPNG